MHCPDSPGILPVGPLPDCFELKGISPPAQWRTAPNGTGFWLVTDYRLGRRVLGDRRFRRSEAAGPKAPRLTAYTAAPNAIISLEGAEHARVRGLVAGAFTERRIAKLAPLVASLVDGLLDDLEAQGKPADFVRHVSARLPFSVLCHLLGIPPDDREIFNSWVNVLFRMSGDNDDNREHGIGLSRYVLRLVAAKRREPGTDLVSELIRSSGRRNALSNRELVTLCISLLMAGYDSTADQVSLCALTIMLDRSLMKALGHDPALIPLAAEEVLRVNPAPYASFPRMPSEPVTIGDTTFEPGQLVVVLLMQSNRDPSVFPCADQVTLRHPVSPHLAFGHGVHRCLGAPLARLQLTTLLTALVRRFPELSLAEEADELAWKTDLGTRGLRSMLVTW